MTGHVAHAKVTVDATPQQAWRALTDPAEISRWMVGTEVSTDWQVGSPITWRGEFAGKPYEDKGEVLEVEEPRRLSMTHFSPLMGDDVPENYHTVTYTLEGSDDGAPTTVTLEQDGNDSEEQAETFSQNWQSMLDAFKETVEKS
ncbi:SRPBCC family protein [Terrabacter terrigena]|uniref:SRPBCC family protein n=1 Tax=Terrabacter terrigena TaxID=574718 RepID=A0ABW3MZ85_9MICO